MNSIKDTLCYKLLRICNQVKQETKRDFQELGLTRENYATLRSIYENPGITQAELADSNYKDRNVTGRIIDRLEEKQYVQRIRGKQDRRSFTLQVTELGKQVILDHWPVMIGNEIERVQRLTSEEQKLLWNLLEKMTN